MSKRQKHKAAIKQAERVIKKATGRSHTVRASYADHGANVYDVQMRDWRPMALDGDADANARILGDRAWDCYISNPLCAAMVNTLTDNVVGRGIWLADGDQAVRKLWDSSTARCGIDDEPINEVLELALRVAILRGDVFLEVSFNPLCISVIDPRRCVSGSVADSPNGIIRDSRGRAIKYLIQDDDSWITEHERFTPERGGILHFKCPAVEAGQERGVTLLAPSLTRLYALGDYTMSEIHSAVVSARVSMAWTRNDDLRAAFADDGDPLDEVYVHDAAIAVLAQDETLSMMQPTRPNPNMDAFVASVAQQITASFRLPLSIVLLAYGTSYTAPRIEILEAHRTFVVWRQRISSAILSHIADGLGIVGLLNFVGPAPIVVDPLREVQASKMRIDEHLSTREAEAWDAVGMDLESIIRQRAAEQAKIAESMTPAVRIEQAQTLEGVNDDHS